MCVWHGGCVAEGFAQTSLYPVAAQRTKKVMHSSKWLSSLGTTPGTSLRPALDLTSLCLGYKVWSMNHSIGSTWELVRNIDSWALPQRVTQNLYLLILGHLYPFRSRNTAQFWLHNSWGPTQNKNRGLVKKLTIWRQQQQQNSVFIVVTSVTVAMWVLSECTVWWY